jgi:hypothetical protein
MACWEHLAAMLSRSPNPFSKVGQAGKKARKTSWFDADKTSVLGREREKGSFKIEGRKRGCL